MKLVVYSVGGGEGTCVVSIAYSKHIYASMYRHGQTLIKMWRGVSHRSDDIATATVAKRGRCVWTRTSCSAFFFPPRVAHLELKPTATRTLHERVAVGTQEK